MTVVAIDGPAGAGKSTVARAVAAELGYTYVDTGAMYRAIALAGIERGLRPAELAPHLEGLDVAFRDGRVYLDDVDVSGRIRADDVTRAVAAVSALPEVRVRLLELQRRFARGGRVVMEGRDIGTVVWPQAEVKVFLTASLEERARRRLQDPDASGLGIEEVKRSMAARDASDSGRSESPLVRAADAIEIDSTGRSVAEVVEAIVAVAKDRADVQG